MEKKKGWKSIIMLLLAIAICLSPAFSFAGNLNANGENVTLDLKSASVKEFFDALKQQTKLSFVYNTEQTKSLKPITIKVVNEDVNNVLEKVLDGTGLSYSIEKNIVTLYKIQQTSTVAGQVVSDETGEPVIGASILVKGTTIGSLSDVNGGFRLTNLPKDAKKLIVSFIGMESKEVDIAPRLTIRMKETSTDLEEVVVQIAYGTAKKTSLTGAISSVDSKQIAKRPVTSVASVLEGTTTGIQVNNTYGQPGSDATIRIRGFSSVNGSNTPLYILDGVPFGGNISDLNATDIESISVLKDAASAALYGNRAANGVILITTKKGKSERTSIHVNVNQGMYNRGMKDYDRLGANDWMEAMWQGYRNQLLSNGKSLEEANKATNNNLIAETLFYNIYNKADNELFDSNGKLVSDAQIKNGFKNDLDWYKPVERTGRRQEYVISGEGSQDKSDYYFSASYLNEEGYVKNSDFERLSARSNINLKPVKWFKTGLTISATHQITNSTNGNSTGSYTNPFMYARNIAPIYPVHLHDMTTGDYIYDGLGQMIYDNGTANGRPQYNARHVAWEMDLDMDRTYRNTIDSQLYTEFKFLKDFTFMLKGDLNVRDTENRTYNNATIGDGQGNGGRAKRSIYRYKNYTVQQQLNWNRTFDKHFVDVLAGHESYLYRYNYLYGYKTTETFAGKVDMVNFTKITDLYDYEDNYTTESYLGRVRYNYDEKYFGEASFRRDGSSRFHPDHRWGNFWSIGGSWMLSREDFMKSLDWVNEMKLRASYGEVGNDAGAGYYGYMALYQIDQNANKAALYKTQNGAENIKWETTTSFGVALEGTLLNRLNFSVEYFDKRSKDLLFDVYLPLSAGATSSTSAESTVKKNLGTVSNRGFEIAMDVNAIASKTWKWNIGMNATFLKNKIVKLPEQNREKGIIDGTKKYMEGHGRYDFWLAQFVGVDQMTGNSLYLPNLEQYTIGGTNPIPDQYLVKIGDEYYTNYTTYAKKDWSGSAIPDVYGNFNTQLSWKNLTLSAIFTYSLGGKTYDYSYANLMSMSGSPSALHKDILKSWKEIPEGMTEDAENRIDPNGIPVINYALSAKNNSQSSRFLISSSYLVFKNIALAYTFPKQLVNRLGLSSASLNGSIENVATFSKRKGMNPQQSFDGTSNDVLVTPRIFTLGLNINF